MTNGFKHKDLLRKQRYVLAINDTYATVLHNVLLPAAKTTDKIILPTMVGNVSITFVA